MEAKHTYSTKSFKNCDELYADIEVSDDQKNSN